MKHCAHHGISRSLWAPRPWCLLKWRVIVDCLLVCWMWYMVAMILWTFCATMRLVCIAWCIQFAWNMARSQHLTLLKESFPKWHSFRNLEVGEIYRDPMAFPGKAVGLLRSRLGAHLRSSSHLVQPCSNSSHQNERLYIKSKVGPYSFNMLQPHGFSVHIENLFARSMWKPFPLWVAMRLVSTSMIVQDCKAWKLDLPIWLTCHSEAHKVVRMCHIQSETQHKMTSLVLFSSRCQDRMANAHSAIWVQRIMPSSLWVMTLCGLACASSCLPPLVG